MHLETERLHIRPYRAEYLQDMLAIFSDPVVMAHCEAPYDRARAEEVLRLFMDRGIAFAVVHKADRKVIGHALFKQLPGEEDGIFEIGWIYHRAYWRQGYAFEAARALLDWGFANGVHKVIAHTTDPVRSLSLMRKLGMQQEGVLRSHTRDLQGRWADLYIGGLVNPGETG